MSPSTPIRRPASSHAAHIRRKIAGVLRSMDFLAGIACGKMRKPLSSRRREEIYGEIYQQLGLAWEFLALRCPHRDGWRRVSGGSRACRSCGHLRGIREPWIVLPREGPKTIGRMVQPDTNHSARSKKEATLLRDSIRFHGARLEVEVHDSYPSSLFKGSHPLHIAPERAVRLHDRGIEVVIYDSMVCVRKSDPDLTRKGRRGPKYGGFPGELPKKLLKKFPVIFDYGANGDFLGLTILTLDRPRTTRGRRRR